MFDTSTPADADLPTAAEPADADRARIGPMGRRLGRLYHDAGASRWSCFLVQLRGRICPLHRVAELVPMGASVLDIGCGRGALLAQLALGGRSFQGVGVDPSRGAIGEAHRVADKLEATTSAQLSFIRDAAERVKYTDRFDVVTMVDVMHHLPRSVRALAVAQAAGAVKPGGVLVYKDMARWPLWRRLANRAHDLLLARQWIREEPIARVEAWAAQAGLKLERAERIHMLWYAHELRVFRKPSGPGTERADA